MKKIIIALLFSALSLCAQQSIDPPVYGSFGSDSINFSSSVFRNPVQGRFLLGWNWGYRGGWLDSALGINAYHKSAQYDNSATTHQSWDGDMIFLFYQFLDYGYSGAGPFNTQCMNYHPELALDSTAAFAPMSNDPQGAVFGWADKAVGQRGMGSEQWRWLLRTDSLTQTPRQKVLSNLWKGTGFAWQHWNVRYYGDSPYHLPDSLKGGMNDTRSAQRDSLIYQPTNGKRWYLSISLKTTNAAQFAALPDTAAILALKIPYTLYNRLSDSSTAGLIRFDSLPSLAAGDAYTILSSRNTGDSRGRARKLVKNSTKPTEFVITKAMLAGQDSSNGITLSAFFRTDGVLEVNGYKDNPILQPESNYTGDPTTIPSKYIKALDIEAYYYPHADIGIDYLRLETQQARRIYHGEQDRTLRDTIRQIIARVAAAQSPPARAPKIFRFYNVEERREQWWGMMRYYNILLDRRATAELGSHSNPPAHYMHATAFGEFWQGDTYRTTIGTGSPTIMKAWVGSYQTFGYEMGYAGNTGEGFSTAQIRNSHYESYMPGVAPNYVALQWSDFAGNDTHWFSGDTVVAERGNLFVLERSMFQSYFTKPAFLYNNKPWWANLWLSSEFWQQGKELIDSVLPHQLQPRSLMMGSKGTLRPATGEESCLKISLPLLLGAKGLFYWRGANTGPDDHFSSGLYKSEAEEWLDSLELNYTSPKTALLSPYAGSDWMDVQDTVYAPWKRIFNPGYHAWGLVGHNSQHIYLGARSVREVMYELHRQIQAHPQELLQLRLQAWYGKGFTKMYHQHPAHQPSSDTLLKHYVLLGQLQSRPLGRVHSNGSPWYESEVSGQDSLFVDITLLKNDSLSLDSVFYVGVQNRRTDPLWSDSTYFDSTKFYYTPTADWDSLLQYGGAHWNDVNHTVLPAAWWQQIYWKRQGCREIVLPLRFPTPPDGEPRLLHVQQILGSRRNALDTIMLPDSNLALRFEPGEGKLFRITIQRARATLAGGKLQNSNQRKMVAFPMMQRASAWLVPSDSMRYHLVYHRYDSISRHIHVYYRRSVPYSRSQQNTPGIEWEGEHKLSQYGFAKANGTWQEACDCAFPTLTVRMDTVDVDTIGFFSYPKVKVYVVYACADTLNGQQYHVVENVFDAQSLAPDYYYAQGIDTAWGRRWQGLLRLGNEDFLSAWGAPTINASWNGNYYAWADSSAGIVTRWKPSYQRRFDSLQTDKDSVRFLPPGSGITLCQHPSLNSYSRIGLGESDAALVWEERITPEAPMNYIPYTRIRLDSFATPPHTTHFLPRYMTTIPGFQGTTNANATVLLLNDNIYTPQHFPMVYRGVEEYSPLGGRPLVTAHWDRVAWEEEENGRTHIRLRGVDAADTNSSSSPPVPDLWALWYQSRIWSPDRSLYSPQLTHGSNYSLASDSFTNISDSAVVLNFHTTSLQVENQNLQLWQAVYGYWSFIMTLHPNIDSVEFNPDYRSVLQMVGTGSNPRLSASLWQQDGRMWNRNRRVYSYSDYTSTLMSSAVLFYKQSEQSQPLPLHYTGYYKQLDSGRVLKTLLSQAKAGSNNLLFRVQPVLQNSSMTVKTDTIYSDWFRAGNTTKLRAFTLGVNNPCVRVQVERRKENGNDRGERFELPYLAAGNDTAKRRNSFTLLRGGNKLYRLALINTCGNNTNSPRYTEEIQLDGLTAADREADLAKGGSETDLAIDAVIDLGDVVQGNDVLALQPNPANEKVTLRFDGLPDDYEDTHYSYELGIYTQVGQRVYSGSIRAGESQTITTSGLLPGVYRVQVRGSRGAVSLPMVIMR